MGGKIAADPPQVIVVPGHKKDTLFGKLMVGLFCSSVIAVLMNFLYLKSIILHFFAAVLWMFGYDVQAPDAPGPARPGIVKQTEDAVAKGYDRIRADIRKLAGKEEKPEPMPLTPEEIKLKEEQARAEAKKAEADTAQAAADKAQADALALQKRLELEKRHELERREAQAAREKQRAEGEEQRAEYQKKLAEWQERYNATCPNALCRTGMHISPGKAGKVHYCKACGRNFIGQVAINRGSPPMPLPNNRRPFF